MLILVVFRAHTPAHAHTLKLALSFCLSFWVDYDYETFSNEKWEKKSFETDPSWQTNSCNQLTAKTFFVVCFFPI